MAAAAASLAFSAAPLSFSLSPLRKCACASSALPKARNNLSFQNSPFLAVSTSTKGGAARPRIVQASEGAISSLIEGPNPKRYLGDDYVVKKVSAKQVEELVRGKRELPLIIGFYATWCGPCVHMAQELEMLAVEYEDSAMFVKVNTDDEYEFARDMQVRGLPTLYFISPDPKKLAIRTEGLVPSSMIKDIIDNEM